MAGQLLLSHILDIAPAESIAIIDPDFVGGSLARDYGAIQSNTTIQQKAASLRNLHPVWHKTAVAVESHGQPEGCIQLAELASELHRTATSLSTGCKRIQGKVKRASWNAAANTWILTLESGAEHQTKVLCCATGMDPRQIDCGCVPTIPLRIALDPTALKRMLRQKDRVLLLGTAHSGTLIMKHLIDIPEIQITCVYRGEAPFRFARDGAYDGIKQGSATVADTIASGMYKNRLTLVSCTQVADVISASRQASWLINATGFEANFPEFYIGNDKVIPRLDSGTGIMSEFPTLICFGACAPGQTEIHGKYYPDISVGSFVDQIQARWPALRQLIQSAQDVAHV